jgi:beta-N-acetylhexosaminidase
VSCGLVIGIPGPALTDEDRDRLQHAAIVGVILFARNFQSPEQLVRLTDEIRALKDPRPVVLVDQEGGRVQRFREGFTRLPPLAAVGRWHASHPERALDLAYRHGRVMAAEVLGHGLDLSLAPVLDLARGSTVIGDRAFSDRPEAVAELAGYYVAGMRDAGMRSCGKHFPGHGSVSGDTHDEDVDDDRGREALAADLVPFQRLAAELDAVMPAHVRYRQVDAAPAGFSSTWINDVLRRELGFRGIVVSDDLSMAAAATAGTEAARLEACARAGCDLALVCSPQAVPTLLAELPDSTSDYADARSAAAGLYGRPSFTLEEQQLVPEFRAWKRSLEKLAGEGGERIA